MLAVDVAVVVTAPIYVEMVFGLPGIGRLVVANLSGAGGYDVHMLVGLVVVVAVAITAVNVFSDLAVRPSTRASGPTRSLGGAIPLTA